MEKRKRELISYASQDFEVFKSNYQHILKFRGDRQFLLDLLIEDPIQTLFRQKRYKESFYLLGMLDYLSRINRIEICRKYDPIRNYHMEELLYPRDVELLEACHIPAKQEALEGAIPEFLQFNIVEGDIRNVV